ncbi:MAG: hypothetical protein ACLQGJ_06635 [Candidatus Dormibacteria bacterium]
MLVLVAFLFAKWAYFDYYYVAAMMLMAAVAGAGIEFFPGEVALPDLGALLRPGRWRRAGPVADGAPPPARRRVTGGATGTVSR